MNNKHMSTDRMNEVKALLQHHNNWRRGKHDEMMNVNELGRALDDACEIIAAAIEKREQS